MGGGGSATSYLAQGLIQFAEEGLDRALAGAEALAKAANMATAAFGRTAEAATTGLAKTLVSALQAPARMIDAIRDKLQQMAAAISGSGLAQLARMTSLSGGLGIGSIFYGASRGTGEANEFNMALQNLLETVGDKLAPYFRMATQAVKELTQVWVNLGSHLQEQVTKWALVVTEVSGFIALLPTIISIIAGIVGAIGTLVAIITSPFTLGLVAIAGLITGLNALWEYMSGGSQSATEIMTDSTKNWFDAMVDYISKIGKNFASMWNYVTETAAGAFNWIASKMAKISDFLADVISSTGEMVGLLPEGTTAELRKMENIKAPVLDPKAFQLNPDDVKNNIKDAANGAKEGFNSAYEMIADGQIGKAMNRIKAAGGADQGFTRGQAAFESGDATTNRLQLAAANQNPADLAKAQLQALTEGNGLLQQVADNTKVNNNVVATD